MGSIVGIQLLEANYTSSSVHEDLKLQEDKGLGDNSIYIGSFKNENDKKAFEAFLGIEIGKVVYVTIFKQDLLDYLEDAKEEFNNPKQKYKKDISSLYENLVTNINSIAANSFGIGFQTSIRKKRNGVDQIWMYKAANDSNFDYLYSICLPKLSQLRFYKDASSNHLFLKPLYDDKLNINNAPFAFFPLKNLSSFSPLQQIYYGAPGTGKSNEIKKMTAEGGKFTKDCTFRSTFHPDSDYASFVGAYKPYWDKEQEKIVYGFRPQSFLKAYIKAWKNPDKNVALVVEEINRGNCAQIFGDIFQLLDREKNGLSKYPIECDVEMQELLAEEFGKDSKEFGAAIADDTYIDSKDSINNYYSAHYESAFDKIKNGKILTLPMNLSILATMNTSDQSLFPMDSAFKRRWDWIYEPIVEGKKEDGTSLGWKVEIDDTHSVDWWKFLQKINAVIYSLTSSEDKQLGYFFCQPDKEDNVTISKNLFIGKVIFYLWNEIFKDYAFEHDVCKKENKSDTLYFADFYDGKNVIKQTALVTFFKHLDENQPKIDGKDVKLIEEITNGSSATDIPLDAENKGDETLADVNSE